MNDDRTRAIYWKYLVLSTALLTLSSLGLAADPHSVPTTVKPAEIDDPVPNPYMGWGNWAGPQQFGNETQLSVEQNTTGFGDDAPLFNWVMLDWAWKDLEPQEGQFNWKDIDVVMNYWSARGKQFVVRLWVTDDAGWATHPGVPVCPAWLWAKGLRRRDYMGLAQTKQRSPDYLDPSYESIYLPALKKLVTAFAARYDKAGTPVIFIQVMGYGTWADWGDWYAKCPWPNTEIKHSVLAKIVDMYADAFKHIQLLMTDQGDWDNYDKIFPLNDRSFSLEEYMHRMALDEGISRGAGLIFTGFIEGLSTVAQVEALVGRYWQKLPFLGEGWSYEEIKNDGTHGTLAEHLSAILMYHTNFFHYYLDSPNYRRMMRDDPATIEEGLRSGGLGYRLAISSASWPAELPAGHLLVINQTWVNRNVGRLYVRHPLKIYLTEPDGKERFSEVDVNIDESLWLKGESYPHLSVTHLPATLPPGEYDLRMALVGPDGKPRIALGIQGVDAEKRYKLGTLHVLPAAR
jgi:hypothetical protein